VAVAPVEHLEAHNAAVVTHRSRQVRDGQVHGSDGGERGDLGAWRRRGGPELLRIAGRHQRSLSQSFPVIRHGAVIGVTLDCRLRMELRLLIITFQP
jgi:hypothetical protein